MTEFRPAEIADAAEAMQACAKVLAFLDDARDDASQMITAACVIAVCLDRMNETWNAEGVQHALNLGTEITSREAWRGVVDYWIRAERGA